MAFSAIKRNLHGYMWWFSCPIIFGHVTTTTFENRVCMQENAWTPSVFRMACFANCYGEATLDMVGSGRIIKIFFVAAITCQW